MKFKRYLKNLKKFAKENPETLEMQVVTSKDDEGNGYMLVGYTPQKGIFEEGDFIPQDYCEEWERSEEDINSVCVN